MMALAKALWGGRCPLQDAFWQYAVLYGLLLNLVTHLVFFILFATDANMVLVVLAFVAPVPYNIFVVVAVWRSAARYPGSKTWADMARLGVVIWMAGLSLA